MSLGGFFDGGEVDPPEPDGDPPCDTCGGSGRVRVDCGAYAVDTDCHCDGDGAREPRPDVPYAIAAE